MVAGMIQIQGCEAAGGWLFIRLQGNAPFGSAAFEQGKPQGSCLRVEISLPVPESCMLEF
jgi:hypothetical protein